MTERRRLAIVTGTSSGIGAESARTLLARGWDVVGIARRDAAIDDARYTHVSLDLGDLDVVAATIEAQIGSRLRDEPWARIGLVNNAATIGPLTSLEQVTTAEMTSVFALNAIAPIWLMGFVMRNATPVAVIRIVNVSSGAAVRAVLGLGTYGSSKAALRLAGIALAGESAQPPTGQPMRDVAILSYEPGLVDTAMQVAARTTPVERFPWVGTFINFDASGMLVSPQDVTVDIAAFLESDPAERFSEKRHSK